MGQRGITETGQRGITKTVAERTAHHQKRRAPDTVRGRPGRGEREDRQIPPAAPRRCTYLPVCYGGDLAHLSGKHKTENQ